MKLQKQSSRKKSDLNYDKYTKWTIVVPQDRIKQLGWTEGMELDESIDKNYLIIKPLDKSKLNNEKEDSNYEQFKKSIKNLLERYPIRGLSWTQIRDKLNYPQVVPNNIWVRRLQKEIGLIRIKKDKETLWRLENDTIYTIGYEGIKIEDFVKRLKSANIQQLIDLREIALSRKNGFSKTILSDKLDKAGINYRHYSQLGSPKTIRHQLHTDWNYEKFFKAYKEIVKGKGIQQRIEDVEKNAKSKKTVLLCFEKDYKTCHRRIIAEELKKRGWKVSHL